MTTTTSTGATSYRSPQRTQHDAQAILALEVESRRSRHGQPSMQRRYSAPQPTICPRMAFPSSITDSWTVHGRLTGKATRVDQIQPPSLGCSTGQVYNTIPLPPQTSPDVDVIPLLQAGSGSGLNLDLGMSPGKWRIRDLQGSLERYRALPATNPPIPSMTVVHYKLARPITVHRSESDFVTVWDVIVTIVEALRTPLEASLRNELREQERNGSRRTTLDWLPGRRLVGLRKSGKGEDVWLMDVI